ncbi:MAG: Flp family type IVb pilin [Planctomycetaceae bacterium]|nr:Flp family type IVb pilin [Planctomycetaceae bacterium]
MIEYALALALISLVAGLGAVVLGQSISTFFGKVGTSVQGVTVPTPS